MRTGNGEGTARPAKSVRECALFLLEYADRTEQELRRKLQERGYSQEEIDEAVSFLTEYGYLNDAAYAERYIRSRSSCKSRRILRMELEKKGVDRDVIDRELEEGMIDEKAQIRRFLEKKGYEPGEESDPAKKRKIMAALARRGYTYDVVRSVMGELEEDSFDSEQ